MQNLHLVTSSDSPRPRADAPEVVAVVIGAGPAGLNIARTLASHGFKVSVFDRNAIPAQATSLVHQILFRSPNARVVGRVDVTDILESPQSGIVRGVRARLRGLHDAEFFADMVVDATGKQSSFEGWRRCVGFFRSEDVEVLLEQMDELALA
jgi:NAD(P)-dependent dehydrogenase (short-subunit alcohol dehydrogenase family)